MFQCIWRGEIRLSIMLEDVPPMKKLLVIYWSIVPFNDLEKSGVDVLFINCVTLNWVVQIVAQGGKCG